MSPLILIGLIFINLFVLSRKIITNKKNEASLFVEFIEKSEKINEPIYVFPNGFAETFGFHYKGQNKIIPLPSRFSYTYIDKNNCLNDSIKLNKMFEKDTCWLYTNIEKDAFDFSLNLNKDILNRFIEENYKIDSVFIGYKRCILKLSPK